jgi:hypothetical protein
MRARWKVLWLTIDEEKAVKVASSDTGSQAQRTASGTPLMIAKLTLILQEHLIY